MFIIHNALANYLIKVDVYYKEHFGSSSSVNNESAYGESRVDLGSAGPVDGHGDTERCKGQTAFGKISGSWRDTFRPEPCPSCQSHFFTAFSERQSEGSVGALDGFIEDRREQTARLRF